MAQSKWEKAFWAAARSDKFKPYPPEHWRKPKKRRKGHQQRKSMEQGGQLTLFA